MHIHHNEKGQSSLEFILTFAFGLGLTFLFLNQAINFTTGFLNHYVNFMASRAYMVHEIGVDNLDTNVNVAGDIAREVFGDYNLRNFGLSPDIQIITTREGSGLFQGTVASFSKQLSSLPFIGSGEDAVFYSESFLGKEPVRYTCYEQVCAAITGSSGGCRNIADETDMVLYDNGC